MNRGQIITAALELGGNPGLTTRAEEYLNLFLAHLARKTTWPVLLTEASLASSSPIYQFSLPADYGRVQSVHLDLEENELTQVPYIQMWRQLRSDSGNSLTYSGVPTHFATNPAGTLGLVWPIPTAAYAGKLLYYKIPAEHTLGTGGDSGTPWYPDQLGLVNAVATYVEAYERESLQVLIDRAADEAIKASANAMHDEGLAGAHTLKMDPATYGGWHHRES